MIIWLSLYNENNAERTIYMENTDIKKIIVLFKTHLDIGFTDFAENIAQRYINDFIPRAIGIGEEIAKLGREEGFVWTTGSWLVSQYLKTASEADCERMKNAVENKFISWHGLPFTMHSELADRELYKYGLTIFKKLDNMFGVNTIAAKNTDVPGHTCAIVPLLADAGIKLLHIGVNPASTYPDVPDLFRWRVDEKEIIVMYDKGDYGGFSVIPGTGTAVCFAHTGDNLGPQSAEQILSIYDDLHAKYPNAVIKSGNLNDVAEEVFKIADSLPVVESELGDTWIHGVGSDPKKVSQLRSLCRYADKLDEKEREKMYDSLLFIPEHTWGLDEKTFLNDTEHYDKKTFLALRNTEPYKKMEASWEEQRNYITKAIQDLSPDTKKKLEAVISEYKTDFPNLAEYTLVKDKKLNLNGWNIEFDESGAISCLEKDGTFLADSEHVLAKFCYNIYSQKEVSGYFSRYSRLPDEWWAKEDFGKTGLENAVDKSEQFFGKCEGVYVNEKEAIAVITADKRAYELYGCPEKMILKVTPCENYADITFAWFNKDANRIPESLSLYFSPTSKLNTIEKMGLKICPTDVVSNGNREMHAVSGNINFEETTLTTFDAPLVSIGNEGIYAFYNEVPSLDKGVWINLFNNQWGTNFKMWYDDDAVFRFRISIR